ncbi:MAG: HAD-IIA family hydrolase [Kiritimatiellia bacterium]|jgi:4-nitrophenyl phosphatase
MNKKYTTLLLDLDGTVYAGAAEVPGAGDFIRRCEAGGIQCLYVTNRANRTRELVVEQLRSYGIPCTVESVVSTAIATARYLGSGSAYVIGEHGLEAALLEQGIAITDDNPDAVVVSLDRQFSYAKLKAACRFIHGGAKFVATNPDACLKIEDGIVPGSGSIVAAVRTGSGKDPVVIGKPEPLLYDMALAIGNAKKEETLVVGDNLATDIGAAVNAGMDSVLLLTGVSSREDIVPGAPAPTFIAENYAELAKIVFPG